MASSEAVSVISTMNIYIYRVMNKDGTQNNL